MNVLDTIKQRINTGKLCNMDIILSKIEKYDVVSFDIFDTLLKRNVQKPTDVFNYMESQLLIPEFAKKRIAAEKQAREESNKNEITLKDIYEKMSDSYEVEELEAESDLLIVNDEMLQVFYECIKHKEVVLISDMYLPEEFIVDILKREGIVGYKKLFLSSTINKTKSSGELFEYVINNLAIDVEKIVHIGDSFKSDYLMPQKLGIKAIHIPTHTPKSQFHIIQKGINENILNSFLDNTSPIEVSEYYRFGYEKFGMFLWGYSKWLLDSLLNENIKNVYFFSRDGLIMKQAFDMINKKEDIRSHYLEVSRRSLRIPILWMNCELEHVVEMISPSKLVSLRTIFDGVGLDIVKYTSLINQYGFDLDSTFERKTLLNNEKLNQLYQQIKEDVVYISKKEYELLGKYINQNKLQGKFAVVDIGWSGGMQRYLDETLTKMEIEHSIKGFYIGVADYYKRNTAVLPELDLNGYLFDFLHNCNAVDKRSPFVGLFETLFLEQDGTVKNYEEIDGRIYACRMPYEYIENGEYTREYMCVQEIQKGALDFVDRFKGYKIECMAEVLFSGIEATGLSPKRNDLKMFSNFRFFDEGEMGRLASPRSALFYITHIKTLKKDFLLSRWKIGFMKQLIKINMPYMSIYRFLLKFK